MFRRGSRDGDDHKETCQKTQPRCHKKKEAQSLARVLHLKGALLGESAPFASVRRKLRQSVRWTKRPSAHASPSPQGEPPLLPSRSSREGSGSGRSRHPVVPPMMPHPSPLLPNIHRGPAAVADAVAACCPRWAGTRGRSGAAGRVPLARDALATAGRPRCPHSGTQSSPNGGLTIAYCQPSCLKPPPPTPPLQEMETRGIASKRENSRRRDRRF